MRKFLSLFSAVLFVLVTSLPALADVSDYLGSSNKPARCPKVVVVRPQLTATNVMYPVDTSDLETASNMIGSTVANKFAGASVIAGKDLDQYRDCNAPVVLAKLKSYSTKSAIFGQHEGTIAITVLRFSSTSASAPDKEIEVSATGERHWGDDQPFMNAVKALCDKIQSSSLF